MMKIINNKYSAWYNKIIEHARTRTTPEGYIERHHIIPRSLGGTNEPVNIVKLTAREHYICHLLLPRFLEDKEKRSMLFALWKMINCNDIKVNSKLYNITRECASEAISVMKKGQPGTWLGRKHTLESRIKIGLKSKGRKHTQEFKEKMKLLNEGNKYGMNNKGRKHRPETIEKMKRVIRTEEHNAKISLSNLGRPGTTKGKKRVYITSETYVMM